MRESVVFVIRMYKKASRKPPNNENPHETPSEGTLDENH